MEWFAAALGDIEGSVETDLAHARLHALDSPRSDAAGEPRSLVGVNGKFANSEDSFIFCGFTIDPAAQNFELSAVVTASETAERADSQSGFGLIAIDTDAFSGKRCRHRNQLLAGYFGGAEFGLRIVGGYTDPGAIAPDGRIVDQSRTFAGGTPDGLFDEPHALLLSKTDQGFIATCDGECIEVPGCDFLMRQNAAALHVGFAVARGIELVIKDVSIRVSEGHASHTPAKAICDCTPEYPCARALIDRYAITGAPSDTALQVVYASPRGAAGHGSSADDPTTLIDAIRQAGPGTHIVLADGIYMPSEPIVVPRQKNGTIDSHIVLEAAHPRASIIAGDALSAGMPLCVLDADYWEVRGIVFANSPLSGLTIFGSVNTVQNCEAAQNGDTGILIIARPDAPRAQWPQRNRIIDCDSHDNCDQYRCNADGFGAKLRVGRGNSFYRCVAYRNIDDGFDLYAKSTFGPTEPVALDECIAYENGATSADGPQRVRAGGVGFKLGGENQAVAHEAWNCIAFKNRQAGFSSNSNRACCLHFCTAAENGASAKDDFNIEAADDVPQVAEGLLHARISASQPVRVSRTEDGDVRIDGVFEERGFSDGEQGASRSRKAKSSRAYKCGAAIGPRKNILIVVDSLGGGGAERVACKLATKLSERAGVYLMFLVRKESALYQIGPRVTLLDASQLPPRRLPTRIGSMLHSGRIALVRLLRLRAAKKRYNIQTTVSFLSAPNYLNALAKGGRRIVCERNDPSHKPKRYRARSHFSCTHADYAVFQTRKVQSQYAPEVILKSCIIPNPVSVTCHAAASSAKKIVTVGRLNVQKNHPLLIRAFACFLATHPGYQLHIYGIGEEREKLVNLAREQGIAESVHFEGFSDDVHAAISDAEMFVLSSDFEGMPNALIEAMMMGLPCISTACTGSDELITDGEDGVLVPVGEKDALCDAMCRLADDPALRARLASNARLRALDFNIDDVVRIWERIF